jgi:hypothetical protein
MNGSSFADGWPGLQVLRKPRLNPVATLSNDKQANPVFFVSRSLTHGCRLFDRGFRSTCSPGHTNRLRTRHRFTFCDGCRMSVGPATLPFFALKVLSDALAH